MDSTELGESELGTKEYWDQCYAGELTNYRWHQDVGDVWFGQESIDRVVCYLEEEGLPKAASVLDIGCGNGMFVIQLACEGYSDLTGIDYAVDGINLARKIAFHKNVTVTFEVVNIVDEHCKMTNDPASHVITRQYDLCHDKGTYDAISLAPHSSIQRQKYREAVCRLLKPGALFVITSCNWTSDELLSHFSQPPSPLAHVRTLSTPQLQFGGRTGSVVSCLVFRKTQ